MNNQSLRVNNRLWIISDTHFGHHNIITYQQRPTTHETIMLSEWIERVAPDDQILHLGDVFLGRQGNPRRWAIICSILPGEKFLILGNHDRQSKELYRDTAGFTIIKPFVAKGHAFTHRPISTTWPHEDLKDWHTNIHGHTHGNKHHPDDGTPLEGKNYINVSVEVMDFKPRMLGNLWTPRKGEE